MLVLEVLHDSIICKEMVLVSPCLEWLCKDCIEITMIRNHYVLIAASRLYWESTRTICVQFRNRLNVNVKLIET